MKQRSNRKSKKKQKKASIGKEYIFICYFFVMIFVGMIGYMVYFHFNLSREFQNSAYNTRAKSAVEKVIRGEIRASGGEVLAETKVDSDGTETRKYPYDDLFAHVVGYTYQSGTGLESSQNYNLLTSDSFILDQIKWEFQDLKKKGDNIITTLDVDVQKALSSAIGDYKGAAVAIEADTGRVLAMVSKPDFDPNTVQKKYEKLSTDEDNSPLLNRATSGLYPPGSTFKIVTSLAYYRQYGEPNGFSYDCDGEITVDDHTIHCYKNETHGLQNFTELFANSCNAGFASVGLTIKKSEFTSAADSLLFNADLPSPVRYKSSRFTLNNDSGTALTMQTSIGQGNTLVTPYHMCLIAAAIANDGALMKPYLVDRIENDSGTEIKSYEPVSYGLLIDKSEAAFLQDLMKATVEEGTGSKLQSSNYTAAGKTGTADFDSDHGKPHSWFVGYAENDGKKIAVSVIVEASGAGSKYAVPAAKKAFDAYFE